MAKGQQATDRFWLIWQHDRGRIEKGQERPEVKQVKGERHVKVHGPYTSSDAAKQVLDRLHDRCLNTLVNGRREF